ncbi:MAG: hypothetical protein RR894_13300 [Terrisporobacter sp.]
MKYLKRGYVFFIALMLSSILLTGCNLFGNKEEDKSVSSNEKKVMKNDKKDNLKEVKETPKKEDEKQVESENEISKHKKTVSSNVHKNEIIVKNEVSEKKYDVHRVNKKYNDSKNEESKPSEVKKINYIKHEESKSSEVKKVNDSKNEEIKSSEAVKVKEEGKSKEESKPSQAVEVKEEDKNKEESKPSEEVEVKEEDKNKEESKASEEVEVKEQDKSKEESKPSEEVEVKEEDKNKEESKPSEEVEVKEEDKNKEESKPSEEVEVKEEDKSKEESKPNEEVEVKEEDKSKEESKPNEEVEVKEEDKNKEESKPNEEVEVKEEDKNKEEIKPIEEVVNIEDAYLRKAINKALGRDVNSLDNITVNDMENITKIDSGFLELHTDEKGEPKRGIKSLSGLEYAKNLKTLQISMNNVNDLTPIKDLTNLEFLEVYRNEISDLTPLRNLKNLEHLDIYNNAGIVNLEPISKLNKINFIDMHYCNRRTSRVTFEDLGSLTNLEFLSIDDNFVDNLGFVKNLKKLSTFSCNNNYVTDLTNIQGLASDSFEDWSGDKFFNMYGQRLKEDIKVQAPSEGIVYKMKCPVTGVDKYVEKIYKTYDISEGLPAIISTDENENISFKYNKDTNELELTVGKNNTSKKINTKFNAVLEYGMYSVTITFDITQDGANIM